MYDSGRATSPAAKTKKNFQNLLAGNVCGNYQAASRERMVKMLRERM
jgi:hypothetical protein